MVQTVRVHTCIQRIEGYIEKKCRCRRFIPKSEAEIMTQIGDAEYTIESLKVSERKIDCSFCGGIKPFVKSCGVCNGQGNFSFKETFVVRGADIYMTSAMKTPRTPTIEKNHILRQFQQDRTKNGFISEAKERMHVYGVLNKLVLGELGAELRDSKTGEIILDGRPEPEDNAKTGTGREYDWGRSI